MRETYKVIDNLENNKAPGPGYINAGALKSGKFAIGTHLWITFNDSIQEKVFTTFPKDAHIITIFKKEIFLFNLLSSNFRNNNFHKCL